MKRAPAVALAALLLLPIPSRRAIAQAPRIEHRFAQPTPNLVPWKNNGDDTAHLIRSGIMGGAAGFAVVGAAGMFVAEAVSDDDAAWAVGLVTGGLVGVSLGIPAGVHHGNGRRGNYTRAALVSAGIMLGGLVVAGAVPDLAFLILAVPVVQTFTSISIERNTSAN